MMEITERKLDSYTYKDYAAFPDDMRCEIIDGEVFMMSPAPSFNHQTISLNIAAAFTNKLKGKKCKPGIAPLDVFLDYGGEINNCQVIVQPDVVVVCDKNKMDKRGILGSPDLVIEVVSPFSVKHDTRIKSELYERFNVPEYWLVFPELFTIITNYFEENIYQSKSYIYEKGMEIIIESKAIAGLTINLSEIFDDILENM
jgi:Uma2 family endonuclease